MKILDRWAIRRVRRMDSVPLPISKMERALQYAREHGGIERYCQRQDGSLCLTYDHYPIPKGMDPDWNAYWGEGHWS